jgi:hypothetical protein
MISLYHTYFHTISDTFLQRSFRTFPNALRASGHSDRRRVLLVEYSGGDLFFQGIAPPVSSAQTAFTTVFGMGTGGTRTLRPPESGRRRAWLARRLFSSPDTAPRHSGSGGKSLWFLGPESAPSRNVSASTRPASGAVDNACRESRHTQHTFPQGRSFWRHSVRLPTCFLASRLVPAEGSPRP